MVSTGGPKQQPAPEDIAAGDALRAARGSMTQADVARLVGARSDRVVRSWESGQRRPNKRNIVALQRALPSIDPSAVRRWLGQDVIDAQTDRTNVGRREELSMPQPMPTPLPATGRVTPLGDSVPPDAHAWMEMAQRLMTHLEDMRETERLRIREQGETDRLRIAQVDAVREQANADLAAAARMAVEEARQNTRPAGGNGQTGPTHEPPASGHDDGEGGEGLVREG